MPFLTLVPVRKHMLSAHGGAEAESRSRGAGCSQGGAHWGAGLRGARLTAGALLGRRRLRALPRRQPQPLLEGQENLATWTRPSRGLCTPHAGGPPSQGHSRSLHQEVRGRPEPHPQRLAAQRQPLPRQSLPGPLVLRRSWLASWRAGQAARQAAHTVDPVPPCGSGPGSRPHSTAHSCHRRPNHRVGLEAGSVPSRGPRMGAARRAGGHREAQGQRVRALWALWLHGLLPGPSASAHPTRRR